MFARCVPVLLAAALLVAACGSQDAPPPRNPLDETATAAATGSAGAAASATATAGSSAAPASPPPASAQGDPTPPLGLALEVFTGNAIELMAEWLGVPATDFSIVEAEALVWPDGCIGIPRPLLLCTQVLTPGARVVLADRFGGLHEAHGNADGSAVAWAGRTVTRGTIERVDPLTRYVTLNLLDGGSLELRAAPGSLIEPQPGQRGLAAAAPGLAVLVAYDDAPDDAALAVIAWLDADPAR
jgi:hypothetical protein